MIKFFIDRPIGTIISFIALVMIGIVSGNILPTSLLPNVDIPEVNVAIEAKNLSAKEIEEKITRPCREVLQHVNGLNNIESISNDGWSKLKMKFAYGTDMSMAFIVANEKLDLLMGKLPNNVERPQTFRANVSDIPVFHLNIADASGDFNSQRFAEIGRFVNEIFRRRLEQLPEISLVDISGYKEPQIVVKPKLDKMNILGLESLDLLKVLEESNIQLGNIQVTDGYYRYYLKFISEIRNVEDIESINLRVGERIFKLSELADISYEIIESNGGFFYNYKPAIDMAIIKQPDSRMIDLKSSFNTLLEQFRKEYPDLSFNITEDQTSLLDYAIGNLKQDLILGGILAFFCIITFIGNWRAALLIAIAVPVTLLISQIFFFLFNISINIISLGGLILGLSMIIDNSIVVIDTINLHRNIEKKLELSALEGTKEILVPLFSSVLTNCAVFLPLLFLSGLAGAIFSDQAKSVTIGVVSSMIVSVILLPPLYIVIYRISFYVEGRRKINLPKIFSITSWYKHGIDWVFNNRILTFSVIAVLCLLGIYSFVKMDKDRLPNLTKSDVEINIKWNKPCPMDSSLHRVSQILKSYKKDIVANSLWIGKQNYFLWELKDMSDDEVKIYLKSENKEGMESVVKFLEANIVKNFPKATFSQKAANNAFEAVFSDRSAPVELRISTLGHRQMPSLLFVDSLRTKIMSELKGAYIPPIQRKRVMKLKINLEKAALYDVDPNKIKISVSNLIAPLNAGKLQGTQNIIPINISNQKSLTFYKLLSESKIAGDNNQLYPLSAFLDSSLEEDFQSIRSGKQGEYYPLEILNKNGEESSKYARELVKSYRNKYSMQITGSYFSNKELIRQMLDILLISILLLYFILAAQFESLLQPIFILIEIPIAIAGAFIFLYLSGSSINIMSMIGIVVMCGLVINDSILKIDAINTLLKKRVGLKEAIHQGGLRRLKPMIMICLTSIGALMPTLWMDDIGSELQKPLALSLIGGMLVGLLVSIFIVPLIYWEVYKKLKIKTF